MTGRLYSEQIEHLLSINHLGRIGCQDSDMMYIVPVNYIYDGKNIYCHSVPGMKIEMMRKKPGICFQVDDIKSFTKWKSVIVWGRYVELTDDRDRQYAMKLFVDLNLRLKISETAILPESQEKRDHPRTAGHIKPVIYKIVPGEKTGRYEGENQS